MEIIAERPDGNAHINLDFVNDRAEIREAFRHYYEGGETGK